ncbi:TrmH family RNA methyltransferase [Neisseria sp. Ec49-e6-T10]|uniref:TrmH family RNA methyltransferase n=1 Tax=Neisseria sp. Ec49-e6-T10 TaxID=3140744 RepID=UPI003EBFCBE4
MNTLPKIIDSIHNEQLKVLTKLLKQSKERVHSGLMVLEGIHLLDALLHAKQMPKSIFIHENKLSHPQIQTLLNQSTNSSIYQLTDKAFNKLKSFSSCSDLFTICTLPRPSILPQNYSCIILENIQDTGNLGTILRSAAAANIKYIILNKNCADVFSPKVLRAAMGAHFILDIHTDIDLPEFLKNYRGLSFATTLTESSSSLYQHDLSGDIAFILGNEGSGVSLALQDKADHCIHIPMNADVESLNVAMAATICVFERMRQKLA